MLTWISGVFAVLVNFAIPQTKKYNDIDKKYYPQIGFPY